MKRIVISVLLILPYGVFSCNLKKWNQTSTGLFYKIYTDHPDKPKPVYGDHIWMHLQKFGPDKRELFNTRIFDVGNGVDMEFKVPQKTGDITEIFLRMGKGDSATVKIPAQMLDSNGSKKRYYSFKLNLLDFKPKEQYLLEKTAQTKQQRITDSLLIADYILQQELNGCRQDAYGNWFWRDTLATTGNPIREDDSVSLHYIGRLTNGDEFDNSYSRNQSFTFTIGKKQVIDGLDKGIQNFYTGDKGILIIPSRLGYGDREVGKIPANAVLIFELEVLK